MSYSHSLCKCENNKKIDLHTQCLGFEPQSLGLKPQSLGLKPQSLGHATIMSCSINDLNCFQYYHSCLIKLYFKVIHIKSQKDKKTIL